jgi:hypothetical protein
MIRSSSVLASWRSRIDTLFLRFDSPLVIAGFVILIVYGVWWARFDYGTLFDFGSFVASGHAAAEGLNPYDVYPLTFRVWREGQTLVNYNLNPPIVVLAFQAIGRLDPWLAFEAWFIIQVACYGLAMTLLLRAYPREQPGGWLLWLLALGGVWDTLQLGQIYLPMALAAAAAWIALDRRQDLRAGLLIGIVAAIKPNLLVWPTLLLLSRHHRAALSAFAVAALLSLLPVLVDGLAIYRQWFALILSDANRMIFPTNMSLGALAIRFGVPWLGSALSGALLACVAWWAWRSRPSALDASAIGLVAALLASPIAWVHYIVFLLPVFFYRALNEPLRVAALLFALPVKAVLIGDHGPLLLATLGSLFNYALIVTLAGLTMAIAPARLPVVPKPAASH